MRHASIRRCFRGTTFLPSCCCKDAMAIMLFVRSAQYLQVTEPPALRPSLPFLARVGCITTSSKARRESRSIGFCTGITFEARGREWKPRVVQTPERVDISFATNGRGTCTMYMCVAYIVAMHISMKSIFVFSVCKPFFCLKSFFLFSVTKRSISRTWLGKAQQKTTTRETPKTNVLFRNAA